MNNGDRKQKTQMHKILKRMLALLIAVVLVAGLGLTYSADRVLKASSIPEEEAISDVAEPADTGVSETTKEISLDSGKQETHQAEAPKPEPEKSAETPAAADNGSAAADNSDSGQAEETASESEAASDEQVVTAEESSDEQAVTVEEEEEEKETEPEADEEEIKRPAQKLTAKASDGAMVTVNAPEGALPEGSRVTIRRVSSSSAKSAIERTLGEDTELVDVVVYDIVIYDADGKEVQPDSSVRVSITGAGVQSGDNASLYHVAGNSADKVADVSSPDSVSFSASHFSEYAIATTSSSGGSENEESDSVLTVEVGSSITVNAPDDYRSYTWSVSPKNYASVSGSGDTATVTGLKAGTVTVTCKMNKGGWFSHSDTEEYTVRVIDKPAEAGISISPQTATLDTIGATQTLKAQLTGIAQDNAVVWTSSDPSVATVENGVVTAVDEGTAEITASVSPEEDELYGNTYSASATVKVAFASYNLYHYALIPGMNADSVGAAGADASWFGLGVTKVSGVPNPASLAKKSYNYSYKIGEAVNGKTLFPDLSYGGKTFRYAPAGSAESEEAGYYTVTPFRLVVADGANAGNNRYNSTAGGGNTYHLDYMCVLNEESYVSTSFVLKDADSTGYEALMDYGQRFRAGTSQSEINKPSASAVPATKKYNGITYRFDGWYLDAECTQKADFAGTIDSNMTFYGRYVPSNARYRVEYYYDGVIDASLTETKGPADIGTEVSSYDPKPKNGFNLSDVIPASVTIGENESENVIRVYYTKRLVSYRVGHYLAGTNEAVAPAVTKSCKFGETGSGSRLDLDGYTPVDSEKTKSAVIEATGTEIRFYYYRNVTITANSAEYVYNGETQSISGYTCDQPEADFGEIEAGISGKDAGTYDAVLDEGLKGRTDSSGRYIVTGLNNGSLVIKPADVTVTANASGKAFGQEDPALTASVSGLFSGDDKIEYSLSREPGEEVGEYAIHAEGDAEQGNYHVSYADNVFTVSKSGELTLAVTGYDGVYDGQTHAVTAVPSVSEGTAVEYSIDGGRTWSTKAPVLKDAGELPVEVRAVNPGYEDARAETVLKITPRPVTVTAVNSGKTYGEDDPELTASVSGTIGDDTVSYAVSREEGDNAGSYAINVSAAKEQGNYIVSTVPGVFTIEKAVIDAAPVNIVKLYDGQPADGALNQEIPSGTTVAYSKDGENWSKEPPSMTDAGTLMYSIRLENANYETAYVSGVISISKRSVILRSGSASGEYDGNALTNSEVTIDGDGFVQEEGADFNVTGKQTVVGTSENTFTYELKKGTSEKNYDITTEFGKLEVTNRDSQYEIELVVNGGNYIYDGTMKTAEGFESQYFTINGNKYYVDGMEAYLEAVDAGEYTVIAKGEPHVYDTSDNDVSEQFKVVTADGKLTISRRKVVMTSASATRPYDGSALTNDSVTISGDDFAPEEGAYYSVTGSRKTVGSCENSFTYFLNEGTKASNYDIITVPGTLTVTSRPEGAKYEIAVRAAGGEFTYDGEEHSASGIMNPVSGETAASGESLKYIAGGHEYSVSGLSAERTAVNAGTYRVNVTGSAVVKDEEGNDVSDQFVVNPQSSELTIAKRTVILTSASDSRRYNGKPLTNGKVTVGGDRFADGEGAEYVVTGSQTLAGSSPNRFTYKLNEGTLADNYDIRTEEGTLSVTNRDVKYEIEAIAASDSVVYDGTEKTVSGFEKTEFDVEGTKYTLTNVKAEASATAAGTYTSVITGTPVVQDPDGNDVTEQFAVNLVPGSLEIKKRSLILTSQDAEKQYDGTALTNSEVSVSGDGFAEGESLIFDVTGSRTLLGTAENVFSYFASTGTDLNNYDITVRYGTLLVRDRDAKFEITLRAPGEKTIYDGKEHSYEGFEKTEFEIGGVKYSVSGISVGCSGTDAGTYKAEVTGKAVVRDADGNDVTGQFIVNTEAGDIVIMPREITLTSGTASREYDGKALTNGDVTVSGDGFAEGEGASYTVTGSQKTAGASENSFSYKLDAGTKDGNYIIRTVPGTLTVTNRDAKYSIEVTAASGSYKYDGSEKKVEGLIKDQFEVGGNVYTVSGLKAEGRGVHAGTYPVSITGTAVVKDEDGTDVTDQFAVSTVNGTLSIGKRTVILTSASAEKVYDGIELLNDEVTVSGDGFAEGEGASYSVTGRRTIAGSIANLFSYILNEGTKADDYRIELVPGCLTVLRRTENERYEISVTANSGSFIYDGEAHTVSGLQDEEDGVISVQIGGRSYKVNGLTAEASLTDAGTAPVVIEGKPVVTDSEGNDVTSEFRITPVNGTIRVARRHAVLTSATDSKQYDGEALTNDEVAVSGDGFAKGEGASYNVTGMQKLVGTSSNVFTYTLNTGTKADNYIIETVPGTLTVTNRDAKYELTVKARSGKYKYSGKERTVEGFDEETFDIEGKTYTVSGLTAKATATDAGTYPVNVTGTARVTDAAGNDVTDQFAVTPVNGSLEITRRYVELTSACANKQYDGKALTADEVTVSRDGFCKGEGAEFEVTGSQTLTGSSPNTFSYSLNEGTKADNYIIKTVPGRLTVSDRQAKYEITLKPKSERVTYDGEKHVTEGFEETEFTVNGVTYSVTGVRARAAGMNAGEHPVVIEGGPVILDSDGNDVSTQFITNIAPASLVIDKRSVILTSATASKEYDGKALTADKVEVTGDGFVKGEGASFEVTGTQKTVGTSPNSFTYNLRKNTSAGNYSISTVPGTLTVTNRDSDYSITVEANSGSYMYDGTEKTAEGLKEENFTVDGNVYTVSGLSAEASGLNAGNYPVNITGTAVVTDAEGNDVSDQFSVSVKSGNLEISKRTAVFTSAGDEKEYNGTPLTNDTVTVTGDGFAEGEGAAFNVTGSRVLAGESDNTFTYSLNEGTLADNYEITVNYGKLSVTDRSRKYEIELIPVSDTVMYDGNEHSIEGFEKTEFTFGGVTYTVSGITAEASGRKAGSYPVATSGKAVVKDAEGNDVTDQFSLSIRPAELRITPRAVTLTSASATSEYSGDELRSDEVTVSGDGFIEGEGAAYSFTGGQTVVGISENTFEYSLNEGTDPDNYIITVNAGSLNVVSRESAYTVTVQAAGGSYMYDGTEKKVEGLVETSFEVEGNRYEVSGLSAESSAVHAGTYTVNVKGTPVVTDAAGNDVTSQFRVETLPGTLEIRRRSVVITSGSAEKTYDGDALTAEQVTVSGDGFAEGEGAEYDFAGSRLIPGSSENAFTYRLNENTSAADYNIRTEFGALTVARLADDARFEIKVSAKGGRFLYDGEEHTAGGLTAMSAAGKAADNDSSDLSVVINGHTYTVTGLSASRTETDAGKYNVNVTGTPAVLDAEGNDVTDEFVIRTGPAVLEIDRREVILTSGSSRHAYNGNPLTNSKVEVSGDGFASGEGAAYEVTGTRTVTGTSTNTFTYSLNEGTRADNYVITTVYGLLSVTERDAKYLLTMTPESGSYLYDGSEKHVSGFVSTHAVIDGNRYEVSGISASASGTHAGEYGVIVTGTPVVTDSSGNDVTDQFAVEILPAKLTIRPRYLILRSSDISREYDGTPLAGEDIAVEGDGLADGDEIVFSNHSGRTITGVSTNTFDWAFAEGTDPSNYDVSVVYGLISVTGRDRKFQIELKANSDSVEYDGEEHTVSGFEKNEFLIENNEYSVSGIEASASGTEPGVYGTELSGDAAVTDASGENVTDEFAVSYVSGSLSITEPPQTPAAPASGNGSTGSGGGNGGTDSGDVNGGGDSGSQPAEEGSGDADSMSMDDAGIPYANAPSGYWALLNLIMAVLSVIIALINGMRWLKRRKDEESESEESSSADEDEDSTSKKIRGSAVLASVLLAVISVIAFILTEDMTNTMAFIDKYTILMAVLLAGGVISSFFRKKKEEQSEQNQ